MLATILKQRRLELNLTQQAVADQLHTTRQTISNWETGKNLPDVPLLIAISDLYELSLDTMLKSDSQYVQKVTTDYQLINQAKKQRHLDYALVAVILLLIATPLLANWLKTDFSDRLLTIIIIAITTVLVILSYYRSKSFFPNIPGTRPPLFVPRTFGVGLTINPNHPLGKLLWLTILLILIGSIVWGSL